MANRANFRINPANALGIESDENRAKLISLALSKPENYYKLRSTVISAVTKEMATRIYDLYFDILTEGYIPRYDGQARSTENGINDGPDGDRWQLCFPTGLGSPYAGQPFTPKLPEAEVNIRCSQISDQIREIAHDIVERIMPMNHLEMAQKKQTSILEARGH